MLETIVNKLAEQTDDSWSLNLLYLSSQWKIPSFIQRDAEDTRSPHVILEKQTGVISSAHPHMLGSLEVQHICFWGQLGGFKTDTVFYVQNFPDFVFYYRG